jgi:hypothetical protein
MTSPIVAGSRITAALIQSIGSLQALKQADQNYPNTTLTNDTGLILPVVAGLQYKFQCHLNFEGGTQGASDIKWTWSLPTGATLRYNAPRTDTSGTARPAGEFTGSSVVSAGTNGAGNLTGVTMTGSLFMSSTSGFIQLQAAQNSPSGTNTIIHAQSDLTLWLST